MKNIWIVPAVLACSFFAVASAFGQEPMARPVSVSIDSNIAPVVSVTGSTLSISGTASAGTGVTRVTWQTSNGATGTACGTGSWEAAGIPVAEGNTTVVLRAYDSKGSSAWVALVAVRPSADRQTGVAISSAAKLPPPPAL